MFGLGPWELAILAVIILFLFGANRIPEIGKGLGGALREFKNIKKELNSTDSEESDNKDSEKKESEPGLLEGKFTNKMLRHVPGAKKAMAINDKIKKVKAVIK